MNIRHYAILFVVILFFTVSCTKNRNSLSPSDLPEGHGILTIKTNESIYTWEEIESMKEVIIQGTLRNNSIKAYYSRLGDFYNSSSEQGQLLLADNSDGCIEKYDESNNTWHQTNILAVLIEGSRIIRIKPSEQYSVYGHLLINRDKLEIGEYRIRIDYYEEMSPDSNSIPYHEYSNVFELK